MAPSGVRSTLIAGRRPALHCPRDSTRTSERAKNKWQRTSGSLPTISGESVKGGILPFHKTVMTNRNSPPRAEGAQGSFDCRREAPGGPRTGPQIQAELRPKAIPDHGPVRGPLDPDCRSETGAPLSPRFNAMGYFRARKKQMAANLWFAAGDFGGMCERGDSPLSQLVTTNRNSPKCASGARGSFDCGAKRRAVRKGGSPPTRPHLVSLPGSDAPLPNRFFAAVMKRGHWGVSGLFGGSQTFSTSCQASASGTPLRRVR